MTMNQDRVAAVADAIAELGYNGIVAFDRYEPEYDTIERFQSTFDNQKFVDLLLIVRRRLTTTTSVFRR